MKEEWIRLQSSGRRVGRPRTSGPDAESSPLGTATLEERRAFILETAARLFHDNGYAGTSVGAIARELRVSKATIHYYWRTKEELLEEIQDRALLLLRERLSQVEVEDSPYGTWLEATVSAYIDAVFDYSTFISVLLRDFAASENTREKRREFMRQCQEAIQSEISTGKVRNFDSRMLTLALVGMCSTIANWYDSEGTMSREEIKETYMSLASRGFLPPSESSPTFS